MAIILPSDYYFANKSSNEENLKATPTVIPEVFYANYYEEITPKDLAKVTIEAAREMLPTMEELKKNT